MEADKIRNEVRKPYNETELAAGPVNLSNNSKDQSMEADVGHTKTVLPSGGFMLGLRSRTRELGCTYRTHVLFVSRISYSHYVKSCVSGGCSGSHE
jgi:hypothetical protein